MLKCDNPSIYHYVEDDDNSGSDDDDNAGDDNDDDYNDSNEIIKMKHKIIWNSSVIPSYAIFNGINTINGTHIVLFPIIIF